MLSAMPTPEVPNPQAHNAQLQHIFGLLPINHMPKANPSALGRGDLLTHAEFSQIFDEQDDRLASLDYRTYIAGDKLDELLLQAPITDIFRKLVVTLFKQAFVLGISAEDTHRSPEERLLLEIIDANNPQSEGLFTPQGAKRIEGEAYKTVSKKPGLREHLLTDEDRRGINRRNYFTEMKLAKARLNYWRKVYKSSYREDPES